MIAAGLTVDELREALRLEGLPWYVCQCGRRLYEHSTRTIPNTGGREHVCSRVERGYFTPVTLPALDYTSEKGLHRP